MKNVRRKWKKFSALALAVVLVGTGTNVTAFAAGICDHHLEHTAGCGYVEAVEGADCTHEHGNECYSEVVVCVHEHDENCGYAEGSCTHACSAESRCITTKENCNHSHDEDCGYVQAQEGTPCSFVCDVCEAEVSDEEEEEAVCICTDKCSEETINAECPVCGVQDADLSVCIGEEEEAVTCTCGTDDPAIHATNCPAYVAPANPVCICAMKCSEDTLNVWCDICGVRGVSACQGEDTAVVYDDPVTFGNCGAPGNEENVTWNFDSATGTLTISGTGAMKDMSYDDDGEDQPWLDYRDTITKIVIGSGITQIGKVAFCKCENVEEVVFERDGNGNSSVATIGNHAFRQLKNALTEIVIPASVNEIGDRAFQYDFALKNFYYPSGVSFGTRVLYGNTQFEYAGEYTINGTDKTCSVNYVGLDETTWNPGNASNLNVSEIIIPKELDGYEVVEAKIGGTTISVPSDFEAEHTVERLSDITALDGWTYEAETDTLSPGSSIDVTAIYSVSGTPKLIKEITISRSACADANNDHVCDYGCGRTIGSADDGNDNNTSEETKELKETEEQIFTRELLTKVAGAKAGDNVVIDATIWHSFSAKVLEQLFAKEGVSYTIYYYFKGEYFYITIPANAALEEGCDWYGPLKLNAMFGRTMITKAEYEEAIAKIKKQTNNTAVK